MWCLASSSLICQKLYIVMETKCKCSSFKQRDICEKTIPGTPKELSKDDEVVANIQKVPRNCLLLHSMLSD